MSRNELDQYIGRLVDDWPPLTAEQRDRLRILLRVERRPTTSSRKAA
ncbi:hypothetical protein ACVB8X_14230 [Streptomyces sp. NRAIS4]